MTVGVYKNNYIKVAATPHLYIAYYIFPILSLLRLPTVALKYNQISGLISMTIE